MNLRTSAYEICLQHEYSMINLQNEIKCQCFWLVQYASLEAVDSVSGALHSGSCMNTSDGGDKEMQQLAGWYVSSSHTRSHTMLRIAEPNLKPRDLWMLIIAKRSMCSCTSTIYSVTDVALKIGGEHCAVENVHEQMIGENNVCMNICVSVRRACMTKLPEY